MFICYQPGSNGILYGIAATTQRVGSKVVRGDNSIYLGRVLDRKRNIFQNRKDGIFQFDLKTCEKLRPPADFVSHVKRKNAKTPELLLDFGDSYFLDRYITTIGMESVISAIEYGNPDTLKALVLYYILTKRANSHAQDWFEGNFVKILYPQANLTSQRISDMLAAIGKESSLQAFFKTYIPYIRSTAIAIDSRVERKHPRLAKATRIESESEVIKDAILIDSTGLPNSIRFPMTAISNHNGKISEEVRLVYVAQQGTGLPIYMRYIPGNVIDATSMITTIAELKAMKVNTKFAIMDAGYITEDNVKELVNAKISFLARFPDNRKIFTVLLKEYGGQIEKPENLIRYGERLLYLKRFKRELYPGIQCYFYLGLDLAERSVLQKNLGRKAYADNLSIEEVQAQMQNKGMFCLISSRCIALDQILPLYYTRQDIEQVFDIGKNYGSMLPLHVQDESTFRGHLLMTFIATIILRRLQQEIRSGALDLDTLFDRLRNQKCKLFPGVVIPQEAAKKQNDIYRLFKFNVPKTISACVV